MTANRAESDKPACGGFIPAHRENEIQIVQRRALILAAQANESRRIIKDHERRLDETRQLLEETRMRLRVAGQRLDEDSRLLVQERQRHVADVAQLGQRLAEEAERRVTDVAHLIQRVAEEAQRAAQLGQQLDQASQLLAQERQLLAQEQQRHGDTRRELGEMSAQMRSIYDSTSWRMMEPARRVARRHPGWATVMRRAAKLIWWTVSLQLITKLHERHRRCSQ